MIDINCDVGEGIDNEHLLMPCISSCSIACGGHVGNMQTMATVVSLAKKHCVNIGAHPSYPDKENFGRVSMHLSQKALSKVVIDQIEALEKVAADFDLQLHHIKPHGALYNDLAKDNVLANNFLNTLQNYKKKYVLYVPYGSVIEKEALRRGFQVVYEAFADRNYHEDLSLLSRKENNAVITDVAQIIKRVLLMRNEGKVQTVLGKHMPIKVTTFCVHSDTKNAVDIAKKLREAFA